MKDKIYLLDTNIISELMKVLPEEKILKWFDLNEENEFYISSITQSEIFLGIELLSEGKKKNELKDAFENMLIDDFTNKCLVFDEQSAREYAKVVVGRNRIGRPISVEDAQIASIAISKNLTLVTRNDKDFTGINHLSLVNPWNL